MLIHVQCGLDFVALYYEYYLNASTLVKLAVASFVNAVLRANLSVFMFLTTSFNVTSSFACLGPSSIYFLVFHIIVSSGLKRRD